jgi:hypothetical protein
VDSESLFVLLLAERSAFISTVIELMIGMCDRIQVAAGISVLFCWWEWVVSTSPVARTLCGGMEHGWIMSLTS